MKYTAHTKGHYGIEDPELNLVRKACRRTHIKRDKSPEAQKVLKWYGNEEQTNISIYHMLQSCGVQAGSYSEIEVKK